MKKTTAKIKNNKNPKDVVDDSQLKGLEEDEASPAAAETELDPEVLKVFVKPKKGKNSTDNTDYIPELERGDIDEEFGTDGPDY